MAKRSRMLSWVNRKRERTAWLTCNAILLEDKAGSFYSLSAVDTRGRYLAQLPEMGRTLCNLISLCSFVLVEDALMRAGGREGIREINISEVEIWPHVVTSCYVWASIQRHFTAKLSLSLVQWSWEFLAHGLLCNKSRSLCVALANVFDSSHAGFTANVFLQKINAAEECKMTACFIWNLSKIYKVLWPCCVEQLKYAKSVQKRSSPINFNVSSWNT